MNFYTFQSVSMHRNVLVSLIPAQMGKNVILVDNQAHKIRGKFGLWNVPGWINGLIHDLWVKAKVNSLPEVSLPLIGEFDTQQDQLQKTLLYEWGTARLELELLLGDGLGNWASFGESAVKNSSGFRYRKHRGLDLMTDNPGFQLEEGFKIAAKLINVGFGDLKSTDKIDIIGTWTQEFVAIQAQPPSVVNNIYGSTSTPTPTPISQAVLTLTLASGTSVFIASGTQITITLKATASKSYTATWRKDGTLTTITTNLTTDANGSATLNFDSSAFSVLGAGKYSLELTDNGKAVTSNELTAVMPTVVVSPTSAYNLASSSVNVTVTGMALNSTYTLEFVGVSGTSTMRTQTAETTTFTTPGTTFTNPGTYKAQLTKGTIAVQSNELTILPTPVFTLTTALANVAFLANDNTVSYRCTNLQKSTALTFSWLKAGTQIASTTSNSDSNGVWEGSFAASALGASPFGEGTYKLRVVQGAIDITSNQIDVRAFKFDTQPTVGRVYFGGEKIQFRVVGIPPGSNFTYTILKSGVAQGNPVAMTFTYASGSTVFNYFELDATTIANTYGASTTYSLRVTYNNVSINSNIFEVRANTINYES